MTVFSFGIASYFALSILRCAITSSAGVCDNHSESDREGTFIFCRRQPQLLDDLLKRGRNNGRGLHVRFAPVRVAALLCHRKPFDCRRALRRSQPRSSGDHALSGLIGNKAACSRRIVIARWSSWTKHPDQRGEDPVGSFFWRDGEIMMVGSVETGPRFHAAAGHVLHGC